MDTASASDSSGNETDDDILEVIEQESDTKSSVDFTNLLKRVFGLHHV